MEVATLANFTCFPKLPLELQMVVWSFCPYVDKQTINIKEASEAKYGIGPYARRSRTGDKLNPFAVDFPDAKFISVNYIVPSPLQICQQSRNVALQHYRRVATTYGDTKDGPAPFYINSYQDSIFFEDAPATSPYFFIPGYNFWKIDGKTLSTPDGEALCTSVATRWTRSDPPDLGHLMYTLSMFPEVKHLYFLDCPSGPFPVSPSSPYSIQWMSRDEQEDTVEAWIALLLHSMLMGYGPSLGWASDSTDMKECKGIFRAGWVLPLISCITTEQYNSLQNTVTE
ncbi:hypothetical protein EAE96_009353 [Botrytis aclada]|nr:hypothetical protein EAE96_009353 [Botrytis aclada]